ncbi:hypothetical protein [Aquimarina sp. MMG016]|uniref:hypothetical protein n=1 Tax=Aquimarina sp. MMG016 TaxID=2822690 RepID=UPI001B3A6B77|nr:hypothetical protein [Aquimarina sp. MMG016]MBQ4819921.1 hypothetical protein [Aquimarina sp. MMG016]
MILITQSNAYSYINLQTDLVGSVEREFSTSDFIFTGTLVEKRTTTNKGFRSPSSILIYTFRVLENIKGKIEAQDIKIISRINQNSCGDSFRIGESYLMYSKVSNDFPKIPNVEINLISGSCNRNQTLQSVKKEEMVQLHKLSKGLKKS